MNPPTDEHYLAARAFLEAYVPGWTVLQWAMLAELLAGRDAARARAA